MLLYDGHIHKKEKTSGEKIIRKCGNYNKNHCPGRVHTLNEEVVKSAPYNHVPDAAKVGAKVAVANMKEMARANYPSCIGKHVFATTGSSIGPTTSC